jgi:hypothetical protein
MLKNLILHPWRLSPNNPWACRHCWNSYEVCQQTLTQNLNMCHTATQSVRLLRNNQKQLSVNVCVLSYERRLTRTQLLSLGS